MKRNYGYIAGKRYYSALAFVAAIWKSISKIEINWDNRYKWVKLYRVTICFNCSKTGISWIDYSTVKIVVGTSKYKATLTTPDSITTNYYLKEMVDAGVEYCFMEVSSLGFIKRD
jgi:hypothetical protein